MKRNLERLGKAGFTYYVGPEIEFFYLKDANTPEPLDYSGYFDQLTGQPSGDLRRDTVLNLADMGIPVKYSTTRLPTASMRSTCNTPTP